MSGHGGRPQEDDGPPGVQVVAPLVRRVLAPNPGPMTLEGTNTWVLGDPGAVGGDGLVVVDPGPSDEGHLARVAGVGRVGLVVLTHGHADHREGADRLAALAGGAPVAAADPALCRRADALRPGRVGPDALRLEVLATPGHTPDSVSLLLPAASALLTGDAVLGRGPSVVVHPEGRVAAHLASLRALLRCEGVVRLLPGHGPLRTDGLDKVAEDLEHRLARLRQVRDARAAGATTVQEVLDVVYADVDPSLREAAAVSVAASLAALEEGVEP